MPGATDSPCWQTPQEAEPAMAPRVQSAFACALVISLDAKASAAGKARSANTLTVRTARMRVQVLLIVGLSQWSAGRIIGHLQAAGSVKRPAKRTAPVR